MFNEKEVAATLQETKYVLESFLDHASCPEMIQAVNQLLGKINKLIQE